MATFRGISTLVLLLFFPLFAEAQWRYVNPTGTADNYAAIHFVTPDQGWALTTHGALMKYQGDGTEWERVEGQGPPDGFYLDMVFTSPLTGIITGKGGVILSTRDGGNNWDTLFSETTTNLQSVFMVTDSTGYIVGLNGTVLKTHDGGTTWTLLPQTTDRSFYDCWFTSPVKGFAAADQALFQTTDGGASWVLASLADSGGNFIRVAFRDSLQGFAVGRKGTVYRTTDGGNSWNRIPTPTDHYLSGIALTGSSTVFISGSGGLILRSVDAGVTWELLETGFPYDLGSIVFTNLLKGFVAGPLGALLQTDDGGEHWKPATFVTLEHLWDCSFADENHGLICGETGTFLKTIDGGKSWSKIQGVSTGVMTTVCLVNQLTAYAAGEEGLLLKTTDGGATWNVMQVPAHVRWQQLWFNTADEGFLVGITPVIWHTTNGGATWDPYDSGTSSALNSIGFNGKTGFACGSGGMVVKTTDGGTSWNRIVVPELLEANLNKLDCINENVCYITGNQTIGNETIMFFAATHDGGVSWQVKTFAFYPSKVFSALDFLDDQTGYAGGDGFIWKTTDGGVQWTDQTPVAGLASPNDLCFINNQKGFAVSWFGQLLSTDNGGGTEVLELPDSENNDLLAVWPNPCKGLTRIIYHVTSPGRVRLVISDIFGRITATLADGHHEPGWYETKVESDRWRSGFYFCRMLSVTNSSVIRLIRQ